MINKNRTVHRMKIGMWNCSTWRQFITVPRHPPQMPHDLAKDQVWATVILTHDIYPRALHCIYLLLKIIILYRRFNTFFESLKYVFPAFWCFLEWACVRRSVRWARNSFLQYLQNALCLLSGTGASQPSKLLRNIQDLSKEILYTLIWGKQKYQIQNKI
jgi:hypothetical protein